MYAPQNGIADTAVHTGASIKDAFYEQLTKLWNSFPKRDFKTIIGDLNARLHTQLQGEERYVGKEVFGRGYEFLTTRSEQDLDNRHRPVDFARYMIVQSFLQKPDIKKCTYIEPGKNRSDECNAENFAQLDHIIIPHKWKNAVKDCESDSSIHVDSDHIPIRIKSHVKLAAKGDEK